MLRWRITPFGSFDEPPDDLDRASRQLAALELSRNEIDPDLLARAYDRAGGNGRTAAVLYVHLRAARLRRESERQAGAVRDFLFEEGLAHQEALRAAPDYAEQLRIAGLGLLKLGALSTAAIALLILALLLFTNLF